MQVLCAGRVRCVRYVYVNTTIRSTCSGGTRGGSGVQARARGSSGLAPSAGYWCCGGGDVTRRVVFRHCTPPCRSTSPPPTPTNTNGGRTAHRTPRDPLGAPGPEGHTCSVPVERGGKAPCGWWGAARGANQSRTEVGPLGAWGGPTDAQQMPNRQTEAVIHSHEAARGVARGSARARLS